MGSEELVWAALRDLETSSLPEKNKVLLRFVSKVNRHSPDITPADMQLLYETGWTDEAIYFAVTVCALFNFYNRWPTPAECMRCPARPIGRWGSGWHFTGTGKERSRVFPRSRLR